MRMENEQTAKTPEVATTRRTKQMFDWVMPLDALLLLPRLVTGLFAR